MMKHLTLPLLMGAALLTGCASVQHAAPDQDAALKRFEAPAQQARIYIYRNELFGTLVGLDLLVDGKPAGTTRGKTFVVADVAPGEHEIVSKGENTSTLSLRAQLGEPSYVWQEVKMGLLSAGSKLHSVDATTGRAGVLESSLVGSPLMAAPAVAAAAAPAAALAPAAAAAPVRAAPDANSTALPATVATAAPAAAMPAPSAAPAQPTTMLAQAPAALSPSRFDYEAEGAAKARGCIGPNRTRPIAQLRARNGAVEDFLVQCAAQQLQVRCELGMCRALD